MEGMHKISKSGQRARVASGAHPTHIHSFNDSFIMKRKFLDKTWTLCTPIPIVLKIHLST
jgi:hypothetical protein